MRKRLHTPCIERHYRNADSEIVSHFRGAASKFYVNTKSSNLVNENVSLK